ncbi:MAG TPA: adenosylcobinamide-GDP ribazoletransferase [Acidimicrobiales bacterium]|jgi:adenosylcobinamide-GDP ribazoletransferase
MMRSALAFLTVVGGAAPPDRRAAPWFGAVGALVGLAVGAAWWAAGELWPPLVAAVLAVAVDAWLTGMLHLDGLADSADGLLPPVPAPQRLAIMSAPDVGSFGVVALVVVLAARVAGFASQAPDVLLVVGLWAAARSGMAVTMASVPYARPGGAAAGFATGAPPAGALVTLVAAAVAIVVAAPVVAGVVTVVAAAAGFVAVVGLARRRLGGYTGDVLGAAGVVAETVGLLVAAAKW